jgi:hypothetical protein
LRDKSDDQELATYKITALQKEMASEQLARKEANRDAETSTKVVAEFKDMVDDLLA